MTITRSYTSTANAQLQPARPPSLSSLLDAGNRQVQAPDPRTPDGVSPIPTPLAQVMAVDETRFEPQAVQVPSTDLKQPRREEEPTTQYGKFWMGGWEVEERADGLIVTLGDARPADAIARSHPLLLTLGPPDNRMTVALVHIPAHKAVDIAEEVAAAQDEAGTATSDDATTSSQTQAP